MSNPENTPAVPAQATSVPKLTGRFWMDDDYIPDAQYGFVHIPKSAGSSLKTMLLDAFGLEEPYPFMWSTLCLIRNPQRMRMRLPLVMGHVLYDVMHTLRPASKLFTFLREPTARTVSAFEYLKSNPTNWLSKYAQGSISEFFACPPVAANETNLQTRMLGQKIPVIEMWREFKAEKTTSEQYFAKIEQMVNAKADDAMLECAKSRLEEMMFFGMTETFDSDVKELFRRLGKPCPEMVRTNVTPEGYKARASYTDAEMELVRSVNNYDIRLYDYALQLKAKLKPADV